MNKNIFIIGSRGYHANYGGWETLTSRLVDYYDDKNTFFYVTQPTEEKSKDKQIVDIGNNVKVIYILNKKAGGASMLLHSMKAFNFCVKFVKAENMNNVCFYILGLKLYNKLSIKKNILKKLGIKTFVNPDGLEWKRSKWSKPVKKFFLHSEKLMLNNCDVIVCDALGIQKYINEKYPNLKSRCRYIAYGSENFDFSKLNEKKVLEDYNLNSHEYCLMVGRCVPEDNYELVIKDYMTSDIKKDLVIITNLHEGAYYNQLVNITNCSRDKRIRFIDSVYDKDKLAVIRKNAYLYIHGHSVGGTNPSLIESLALTDINILYDVCFNKDVGQDTCYYFKEKESLRKILDDTKKLDVEKKEKSLKAKKIVAENFTWDIIVNKYKELFNED